jgi:hypothetical protein
MGEREKIYVMLAGSLLPAFAIVAARAAYRKSCSFDGWDLLLFAVAVSAGGYVTAKALKGSG